MSPPPRSRPRPLPGTVRTLGWASFFNDVASEMSYALLPGFLLGLPGGSPVILGAIEGAADTVSGLIRIWSGAWSDRLRRRKHLVLWGYAAAVLSRPLTGFVTAAGHLVPIRLLDRTGKGLRSAPRDAMIVEATPAGARGAAFGFQRAMDHLGAALGPLLAAGFLLMWPGRIRTLFLLTIVPGAVVLLLLASLHEPSRSREVPRAPQAPGAKLDRSLQIYFLALLVFTFGNATDAFLLVRAQELGVATAALPLLWSMFHVVKSAGSRPAGRLTDRVGPRRVIAVGWSLYAVVYAGFAVSGAAWQAWGLFALYGVFHALTEPAERTLVSNLAGGSALGRAYGWYNAALVFGALPASLLFGWLYGRYGAAAAFGTATGFAIAGTLLLGLVRRRPAQQAVAMDA